MICKELVINFSKKETAVLPLHVGGVRTYYPNNLSSWNQPVA